ncbi:urease accessory protein UreD [Myxococcota bacterium]|nr:urease accessory protein UreD [Myxococcota bacterium]
MSAEPHVPEPRWDAQIALEFALRGPHTRLVGREHVGPLVVQRTFHPEPDGTCHAYLVHPPGGIAQGDHLKIQVRAVEGASAVVTTPAATKIYRSNQAASVLDQSLEATGASRLEWLPQETIAFDGCHARMTTRVSLDDQSAFAGWEILCLGRTRSGERMQSGSFIQHLWVQRSGQRLLNERLVLGFGNCARTAAWSLAERPVVGSFIIAPADPSVLEPAQQLIRAELPTPNDDELFGVTSFQSLLVFRYLGSRADLARRRFEQAWALARPLVFGTPASRPRIWNT